MFNTVKMTTFVVPSIKCINIINIHTKYHDMKTGFNFSLRVAMTMAVALALSSLHLSANVIKVGTSQLEIRIENNTPPADEMTIELGVPKLFGKGIETTDYTLKESENGVYKIDIPTETEKTIGVLLMTIHGNGNRFRWMSFVELRQDTPLILDFKYDPTTGYSIVTPSDERGFNRYIAEEVPAENKYISPFVNEEFYDLVHLGPGMPTGITDKDKIYEAGDKAWVEVLRQCDEVFQPRINNEKFGEYFQEPERTVVSDNLKYFIYSSFYLRYDRLREHYAPDGNRDMPPLEYYRFLNDINYDSLLDYMPLYSPQHFTKKMLDFFPIKIDPIGETPVGEWQQATKAKLAQVIDSVPDILLNLLSATSFNRQLDDELKPFSDRQVKNITEGYRDDLGKILLARNEKLVSQLAQPTNIYDLTAEKVFDLKSFIDKNYPGKPVVVDVWNTWCGPCMEALAQTEPLKIEPECDGVVFLYISDSSSDDDERAKKVPRIGGEHIYLAQDVCFEFIESEGVAALPSYFFFDKNHKLVHKITAFPGSQIYLEMMGAINR